MKKYQTLKNQSLQKLRNFNSQRKSAKTSEQQKIGKLLILLDLKSQLRKLLALEKLKTRNKTQQQKLNRKNRKVSSLLRNLETKNREKLRNALANLAKHKN